MRIRNRIALFVGQADEDYQKRFINGFLKKAFASDYDVCIFSMYRKYQDTVERERGESNIFSLMNPEMFDGAVILKDSIQTANAAQELEERLNNTFKKPIVVIEKESDLFPSICTDCYGAVFELVSHLIEIHGFKDIAFLSGKKWHKHSKERLQGYIDAMKSHGLPVTDDRIIYGDFWYQSGELCAEQLLAQERELPEAVACANDQMAIGLCKAFEANGIRVPDDISVIGYDSVFEGQTSPKSITSALIPAEEFGEYAFYYIMTKMKGETPESFKVNPKIIFGESCGCHGDEVPKYDLKRSEWGTDISEEGYNSIFNTMAETLISQSSLPDFLGSVYSYAYQLRGAKEFHLCLCAPWKHMGQGIHCANEGYSDEMIHAVRYCSDHKNNMVGLYDFFPVTAMLPELFEEHEKPAVYIFTPVFYENECYGYAVVQYGDVPRSYDDIYLKWISSVCRSIEVLRRDLILKQMQERLEKIRNNKFAVSSIYESLNTEEKQEYKLVAKILDENLLDYHFQPIVQVSNGEVYAYEALMRSRTEKKVSPLAMIKYAAMQDRLSDIECATFMNVLEIVDTRCEEFGGARVFMNSIPGVFIEDEEFAAALKYLRKHAQMIVVEFTEEAELEDKDLKRLKAFFGEMNIDIAVDDYGTGYSNVSNLLRYMPNYVKIDRSLISEIQNKPQKRHFVREIIDFCHDNHIMALAEGVETAIELQTVIHLGADLIQGYYTARPSAQIVRQIDEKRREEIRQYYQERIDGTFKNIYIAGKTNRISLANLIKDGCTDIVIGEEKMVYKDISVIGTPQMKTDIHMRVEAGYSGRIILEDVYFSNVKNRPCIELGEHTDVTIVLFGNNKLLDSGIKVPESSRLVIEGDGGITIELNAAEHYGIGNDHHSRHGELVFDQDGPVNINCRGKKGICIGSGLGGTIRVNRGEFNLKPNTETCVGFGALTGNVSIELDTCHIEADFSVTNGILIGSLESEAEVSVSNSALNFYAYGKYISALGTLSSSKSEIEMCGVGAVFNIMSDNSTCFGSLHGKSEINVNDSSLRLESAGQNAVVFGGYSEDTSVLIKGTDTNIEVRNAIGKYAFAPEDKIRLVNGRRRIKLNGSGVEHPVIFDYE